MDYSEFIKHIEVGHSMGVGTHFESWFLTAGHVIPPSCATNVMLHGKLKQLAAPAFFNFDAEGDQFSNDLAVFDVAPAFSPLKLSNAIAQPNTVLNCVVFRRKAHIYSNSTIFSGGYNTPEEYESVPCTVTVLSVVGKYLFCDSYPFEFRVGDSGTPIFFGDKIYGILSRGGESDHSSKTYFLSSKAILDYMDQNKI